MQNKRIPSLPSLIKLGSSVNKKDPKQIAEELFKQALAFQGSWVTLPHTDLHPDIIKEMTQILSTMFELAGVKHQISAMGAAKVL